MAAWTIPRMFEGETVVVIAGGPSATPEAIAAASSHPCIAVRNAAVVNPAVLLSLDADADWFRQAIRKTGFVAVMLTGNPDAETADLPNLYYIGLRYESIRVDANTVIDKRNSGLAAIRVAAEMGATRILTLGIDPQTPGYAPGYEPGIQQAGEPYGVMDIGLRALVAELAAQGVTVERFQMPVVSRRGRREAKADNIEPIPEQAVETASAESDSSGDGA